MLERLTALKGALERVVKWTAYATAIVTVVGYVVSLFRWGQKGFFVLIRSKAELLWSVAMTLGILLLWIWVARLRARFSTGFVDDFKGDPRLTESRII